MSESIRKEQHPLICQLADKIEATWEQYLELWPYEIPEDLGYIQGSLEEENLTIENRCYQSRQFRKLHLELARVGESLDILHCVMFPRVEYEVPIFGSDLVGNRLRGVSAAIADLSPVASHRQLPAAYDRALRALSPRTYSQPRALPAWGDIFSDYCVFVRPSNAAEEAEFLAHVRDLLTLHCQIAVQTDPLADPGAIAAVRAGQARYCQQQQQNDKTRRVLEKSFGLEWTERYMRTMLFDLAP